MRLSGLARIELNSKTHMEKIESDSLPLANEEWERVKNTRTQAEKISCKQRVRASQKCSQARRLGSHRKTRVDSHSLNLHHLRMRTKIQDESNRLKDKIEMIQIVSRAKRLSPREVKQTCTDRSQTQHALPIHTSSAFYRINRPS